MDRRLSLLCCAALAVACASPSAELLRAEGIHTLDHCSEGRVNASVCLTLELIRAEYEVCQARSPDDLTSCEAIWEQVADIRFVNPRLDLPSLPDLFDLGL
jgi:hypothetical protein